MQPARFKSVITIGAQIYSNHIREWSTKRGPDSANAEFMEWATKEHGTEKAKLLAKQFWQMLTLYGDPSFTPDILGTIKANWLIVQGDNDEPVPLQQALDMHQYIPGSSLWVVPNGGHTPHTNDDTQSDFSRISLEFLSGKWSKD
jgi:pimeloyl-ACP methyl ester carboxylesterase